MALALVASWRYAATPAPADGCFSSNASDPTDVASVSALVFAPISAEALDAATIFATLPAGASIRLQQFAQADTWATYTVSAAPTQAPDGSWTVPVAWMGADANLATTLLTLDQRVLLIWVQDTATAAVGDVLVVTQPYIFNPPNARAVVVDVDASGALLLFQDGETVRWTDPDFQSYGAGRLRHEASLDAYVFVDDLTLHEQFRGGYFVPVFR